MTFCCTSLLQKWFRLFFSLRGGLIGLCFVYEVNTIWALTTCSPPLLLRTLSVLLSKNLMSLGAAYHAFGIFITVLAVVGILFNEKNFILPLLIFDCLLFVSHIFAFGYLLQSKNVFLEEDKNLVKYIGQIGFGYFAVILEYNVYRDLVKKTMARPRCVPESLIILPSASSRPINPKAILQQYKAERTENVDNDFHYVYGVSESMLRFLRSAPQTSGGRTRYSTSLPTAVLYNAESESIIEAPPSSSALSALSAVFYNNAQSDSIHPSPPPPYEP